MYLYPEVLEICDYDRNNISPYDVKYTSNELVFIRCKVNGRIEKSRTIYSICNSINNGKNRRVK